MVGGRLTHSNFGCEKMSPLLSSCDHNFAPLVEDHRRNLGFLVSFYSRAFSFNPLTLRCWPLSLRSGPALAPPLLNKVWTLFQLRQLKLFSFAPVVSADLLYQFFDHRHLRTFKGSILANIMVGLLPIQFVLFLSLFYLTDLRCFITRRRRRFRLVNQLRINFVKYNLFIDRLVRLDSCATWVYQLVSTESVYRESTKISS